ncbi:hypothetical protein [Actinophytocola algeriensis]|uniref:Lipoprotein n=1 Tax=Actinophytocola algeriensis TaxID=1768010 RepID=A0A7W7Q9L6_9PSEU|nr:hypothetical protein [Actinophytocola algeriensis]MBB4909550.1 hypothetical protein [Actinophytocola algeriensis]MBE1475540.1 hypothetical protein [Actinophytocola algeriensis]
MKRIRLVAAGAVACVLAGCTGPAEQQGAPAEPVEVTTLAMDADGWAPGRFAALSESPIHLGAFASWYGRGADGEDFDVVTDTAPPGSAYVAFTGNTGCRVPEGIEVHRDGDDLEVRFTGGTDQEECVRHIGAGVYFAVPEDAVDGVRTVNGDAPRDPAGPGAPVDFVPLGDSGLDPVPPAEFGTDALNVLRTALFTARPDHAEQLSAALDRAVPDGKRTFAFVLSGCAIEGAVLVLGPDHITADGVYPKVPVDCETASHYLATFEVDADDVPNGINVTA